MSERSVLEQFGAVLRRAAAKRSLVPRRVRHGRPDARLVGAPVSERSELQQFGAFFAAQRRSAHWCRVASDTADPTPDSLVHQ